MIAQLKIYFDMPELCAATTLSETTIQKMIREQVSGTSASWRSARGLAGEGSPGVGRKPPSLRSSATTQHRS